MLPANMDKNGRHQAPKLAGVVLKIETIHAAKFKDGLTGCRISKTKNLNGHKDDGGQHEQAKGHWPSF